MRILCPFAETTHTPSGDENLGQLLKLFTLENEITYTPLGDENVKPCNNVQNHHETTHTPSGDENDSHPQTGTPR